MTINQAANIVAYNGSKPEGISTARWNAIVAYVTREILG